MLLVVLVEVVDEEVIDEVEDRVWLGLVDLILLFSDTVLYIFFEVGGEVDRVFDVVALDIEEIFVFDPVLEFLFFEEVFCEVVVLWLFLFEFWLLWRRYAVVISSGCVEISFFCLPLLLYDFFVVVVTFEVLFFFNGKDEEVEEFFVDDVGI